MRPDYDSYESEFATAIAAAAFAIHSVEEASLEYQNKYRDGIEKTMSRVKTRKEDPSKPPESSTRESRRFSGKEAKDAVEASTRKRMESDSRASHPSLAGGRSQSKADAWEKTAMAKIRKRYEKMNSTILDWEKKKKMKAKLQMERERSELELRSALNLQHYENKLARIDHITRGSRVQLEEKRRNEESEVKEKAKRIRSTGKVPVRCFCF